MSRLLSSFVVALLMASGTTLAIFPSSARAAEADTQEHETIMEENANAPASEPLVLTPHPSEQEPDSPEQAVFPGVSNRVLKDGRDGEPTVTLNYPEFGKDAVDGAIRKFVTSLAETYLNEVRETAQPDDEKPSTYDMWDMSGTYTLERPNPDVVSVKFNVYSYSGGAHGNLMIRCLNFNLASDAALEVEDLFRQPASALEIFSKLSAEKLRQNLGDEADDDMIENGTTPEESNFSNLLLIPAGLFVEFQPYQVGPWSIGPQQVMFDLAELKEAGPNPAIWPDALERKEAEEITK